jgi:hypothetical protein
MINFKRSHFENERILWGDGDRWRIPFRIRNLRRLGGERGVTCGHSTSRAGVSNPHRKVGNSSAVSSAPWARAGGWTSRMCASKGTEDISIARWITRDRPLIIY